jgi:hypothetical protein
VHQRSILPDRRPIRHNRWLVAEPRKESRANGRGKARPEHSEVNSPHLRPESTRFSI